MRRPIVAGNWKLHGSRAENARLLEEITVQVPSKPAGQCIVCPPFVYLQEIARLLRGSSVELGAQDVCAEAQGAFTGEVSAAMLKDVGCEYVIVGHSERRLIYRESDQLIARKFLPRSRSRWCRSCVSASSSPSATRIAPRRSWAASSMPCWSSSASTPSPMR
jgi:triosephosphate isomerase